MRARDVVMDPILTIIWFLPVKLHERKLRKNPPPPYGSGTVTKAEVDAFMDEVYKAKDRIAPWAKHD